MTFGTEYFLQQLPDNFAKVIPSYEVDDISDDGVDTELHRPRVKSAVEKKQEMFHLMTTEALITSSLHGNFTILQSDFRSFGPSMPHLTVTGALSFLGVSQDWLDFFRAYLQPRLHFIEEEPNAQKYRRKNGLPISYSITDFLGEIVLFPLDFAVKRATGRNLYQVHDDIWFWGTREATQKTWEVLSQFATTVGLNLNMEKRGHANVLHGTASSDRVPLLPSGNLKWGFLELQSNGTWTMDPSKLNKHIEDLQHQLSTCKSDLAWIHTWNAYVARFMATNMGIPAKCLGKAHVEMVILAFRKIQESLAATKEGHNTFADTLKARLKDNLKTSGTASTPDELLYFPIELGGLGLRNPVIPLMLIKNRIAEHPYEIIDRVVQKAKTQYDQTLEEHGKGYNNASIRALRRGNGTFPSWEEVRKNMENTSKDLHTAYMNLLSRPDHQRVQLNFKNTHKAMEQLPDDVKKGWERDPYWRKVIQIYGEDIIREFGGLVLADKNLLPLGLMSMLRSQRVKWQ